MARRREAASRCRRLSPTSRAVPILDGMRDFVTVGSEFYPQLGAYYAARIDAWFDASYPMSAERHDSD